MKELNYFEARTILEENGYEPESIVDITVSQRSGYNVLFIECSIVKIVTIDGNNVEPWTMNNHE